MRDYIASFKQHQLRADQLLPSTCINIGQHTKTFKRGFRGLKLTYTAITTHCNNYNYQLTPALLEPSVLT